MNALMPSSPMIGELSGEGICGIRLPLDETEESNEFGLKSDRDCLSGLGFSSLI